MDSFIFAELGFVKQTRNILQSRSWRRNHVLRIIQIRKVLGGPRVLPFRLLARFLQKIRLCLSIGSRPADLDHQRDVLPFDLPLARRRVEHHRGPPDHRRVSRDHLAQFHLEPFTAFLCWENQLASFLHHVRICNPVLRNDLGVPRHLGLHNPVLLQ